MKQNIIILGVFALAILGVWFMVSSKGAGPEMAQENDSYGYDADKNNTVPGDPNTINNLDNKENTKMTTAILKTNKGDITIELFAEITPKTVANFTKLASEGFYDGIKFHRVIKGFMIQGGDPLTKDDSKAALWGTGGPGYKFADEIGTDNRNDIGTISMANAGPNTNGSQFFINTAANNFLDGKHTVFGKVVAGMETVKAIENTPVDSNDRPIAPVVINSITLK